MLKTPDMNLLIKGCDPAGVPSMGARIADMALRNVLTVL